MDQRGEDEARYSRESGPPRTDEEKRLGEKMDLDEMVKSPWFREAAERDRRAREFVERETGSPEPEPDALAAKVEPDPFFAHLRKLADEAADKRFDAYVAAVNERCAERRCPELAGALILEVARGLPLDKLEARIAELAEPKPSAPGRDIFNHSPTADVWRTPDSRPLLSKLGFDPAKRLCRS